LGLAGFILVVTPYLPRPGCCAAIDGQQPEIPMKRLSITAALGLLFAVGAQAQTAQQSKMTTCNAEAKDMKGDERKAFMKDCLSGKKMTPQQVKMKTCNADAKNMKGDARKKFMSECLKK
jgi:hypothetical protein